MKKVMVIFILVAAVLLAGTVSAGQRPVWVCINGTEGLLFDSRGQCLGRLDFDSRGQALAGPLPPGRYSVQTDFGTVNFTLRPNASVAQVDGPGYTDGELLWLGQRKNEEPLLP